MRHASILLFGVRSFSTAMVLLSLVLACSGCQNSPIAGRMYQSQLENERLLSEFRAQKKENEQLKLDRQKLLAQQAETEKLAAKLQSQLRAQQSGTRSGMMSGLPDRLDSNGRLTSGTLSGSAEEAPLQNQNANNSPWRPIRKAAR
jgi:hypothetical protein